MVFFSTPLRLRMPKKERTSGPRSRTRASQRTRPSPSSSPKVQQRGGLPPRRRHRSSPRSRPRHSRRGSSGWYSPRWWSDYPWWWTWGLPAAWYMSTPTDTEEVIVDEPMNQPTQPTQSSKSSQDWATLALAALFGGALIYMLLQKR